MNPQVKSLLNQIIGFDNIPRKKAKFENFLKNNVNQKIGAASNGFADSTKENNIMTNSKKENVEEESGKNKEKKEKSKKRKHAEKDTEDAVEEMQIESMQTPKKKVKTNGIFGEGRLNDTLEMTCDSPFKWKDTIYSIVKNQQNDGIKINKLKKKVISAYFASYEDGTHKTEEEVGVLFKNKLKSSRKCMA